MIDMNVLRDLTNAFGPSGFEEDVVRAVRKHCTGMSLTNDAMNNVYARIGGNAEGRKPVLMLDAHTDECGFMVQGDHGKWSVKPDHVRWNGLAKHPGTYLTGTHQSRKAGKGHHHLPSGAFYDG